MPEALAITRADHTASELREVATRSNDADATRRMLALALVLEGYKRGEAGKLCGMDRQTLRDWVIRYNAEARGLGRFAAKRCRISGAIIFGSKWRGGFRRCE